MKQIFFLCCVIFNMLLFSCNTTKYAMQVSPRNLVQVKVQKIQRVNGTMYLYGIVDNEKVRIASFPDNNFRKNDICNLNLTSFRELLIHYHAIPVNYLHVDLSNYALTVNDSVTLKLEYKSYKDVYLTPEMKLEVIKVIN